MLARRELPKFSARSSEPDLNFLTKAQSDVRIRTGDYDEDPQRLACLNNCQADLSKLPKSDGSTVEAPTPQCLVATYAEAKNCTCVN